MEAILIIVLGIGLANSADAMPNMFEDVEQYNTEELYISCVAAKSMGAAMGTTTFFKNFELGIKTKNMHTYMQGEHVKQVAEHVHTKALNTKPKVLRMLRYGFYQSKLKRQLKRYCS